MEYVGVEYGNRFHDLEPQRFNHLLNIFFFALILHEERSLNPQKSVKAFKNLMRSTKRASELLAKTEFSREFQPGSVLKSLLKFFATGVIAREFEDILVARINHSRRQH